jgi:PIN domain nuclease of toxin-antitoxin system
VGVAAPTVLLDTHTLLWATTDSARLSDAARTAIAAAETRLISTASCWELAIKHRAGKLPGAAPLLRDWDAVVGSLLAVRLDIAPAHAIAAAALAWDHRDPFDRLLAAQALICGAHLVTQDAAFTTCQELGRPPIW